MVRICFALIVAPLLALGDQALAYALVGWACAHQSMAPMHAAHTIFLSITTLASVAAWRRWRETATLRASASQAQLHFLAGIAMTVAALSSAAIAAMWTATWVISSCIA